MVSFEEDITDLRMCENRDFVVPVNILTPFARVPFSCAVRHTTMCLDYLLCQFYCYRILHSLDTNQPAVPLNFAIGLL